jgi:hypothetical protein
MSCCISLNIKNPTCRPEGPGGIQEIYLANIKDIDTTTKDTCGSVTDIAMCLNKCFYTFEVLDETAQFTQLMEKNNGVYNANMTLLGRIIAVDCDTLTAVKQLAGARVVAIFKDNNGFFYVAGLKSGLTLQSANFDTGVAKTDAFGTAVTLTGFEGGITGGFFPFLTGLDTDPIEDRLAATQTLLETIACESLGAVCGCDVSP